MNSRKNIFLILFVIFFQWYAIPSHAQERRRSCYYYGEYYPDGYIIGDHICQDGTWVRIR